MFLDYPFLTIYNSCMAMLTLYKRFQEKRVVQNFRRVAERVPFYKRFLAENKVNPSSIRTITDFRNLVPILNKDRLYVDNLGDVTSIFSNGSLKGVQSIFPSSGFSGKFSFGLLPDGEFLKQGKLMDYLLNLNFGVLKKKTLLINCLSMGINVPATKVVTINTGLRSDIIISVLKAFSAQFEQILLIGENAFIKKTLEDAADAGIDWRSLNVHIIFGGESFPESFRHYLESIIEPNPYHPLLVLPWGFQRSALTCYGKHAGP
jgi:phenylacetate-CoA ligase